MESTPHNQRETLFPGIGRQAAALGKSRVHLHLVLKGTRKSKTLLQAWKDLMTKEGKPIPAALKKRKA